MSAALTRQRLLKLGILLLAAAGFALLAWPRTRPERRGVGTQALKLFPPRVSVASRVFSRPFQVELSTPASGEIRYTLDGSEPSKASSLYTRPIEIGATVKLSARVIAETTAGPLALRCYVLADEALAQFRSNLPVILIETFGHGVERYRRHDGSTQYVSVVFHVVEPGADGVTRVDAPAAYSGPAAIRARGSSTLGREKTSLAVELQDNTGESVEAPLLGLPVESDWVLLGPLEFDRALVRNSLVYQLARDTGWYAPRTRFVELFLNEDPGPIQGPVPRGNDYYGVYLLIEKIKRGPDRVAVESMNPSKKPRPITGGYILKIDRPGPGDSGFFSGGHEFQFVYPKESKITSDQSAWIQSYLDEFHTALSSTHLDDPNGGYSKYLDVESAIDYHVINEFTKNPDSYVYSTYFHKTRDGKLVLGPVWDFDRTMGCDNDRRAHNPFGWSRNSFQFWYRKLFRDPAFRERYRKRWEELRRGPFLEAHIEALLDEMARTIGPAAERNTARWKYDTGLEPGGWSREIEELKLWIQSRLEWYDAAVASLR